MDSLDGNRLHEGADVGCFTSASKVTQLQMAPFRKEQLRKHWFSNDDEMKEVTHTCLRKHLHDRDTGPHSKVELHN